MFTGGGSKKHHHSAGYLARPRMGAVRGVYSTKPLSTRAPGYLTGSGFGTRKMKYRKSGSSTSKMDAYKKRPDPVDTAYREAVGRLKVLLAESYTIPISGKRHLRDDSGDDTDNQSLLSSRSRHSHHHYHRTSPFISRRYPFYTSGLHTSPGKYEKNHGHTDFKSGGTGENEQKGDTPEKWNEKAPASEVMSFIHRQEDYIDQLESEAQFCRDELSGLLGKVKEVISENENLHEKQKCSLIKTVFDHLETETETDAEVEHSKSPRKSPRKNKRLEGPSIVFESRISELEAQLTQIKIELRKCQEENENYKRKIADGTIGDLAAFDTYKIQIDNLQREKGNLQEQISKLQYELAAMKERNNDTTHKIKRSLDVVEQAQFEKTQLESEIRRLKDELDRQHDKLRETIHDQGRRVADERAAIERRYTQQIEQLTAELGVQWETTSKLQLELDKQRREDSDAKREIAQKQAHIDDMRKEMQTRTGLRVAAALQSDLASSAAEKGALEQQISSLHLAVERAERQGKQEASRLQAEVQSLRQRLDRADADLLHSRRENLRLSEQIAALEKELKMNAMLAEEKSAKPLLSTSTEPVSMPALPLPAPSKDREKELSSMIQDMESKHVATVAELEGMIHSQNQLMEKLTNECHLLTQKLEDASNRHKEEIRELHTNLDYLNNKFTQQSQVNQPSSKDEQHYADNLQRTSPHYNGTPTRHVRSVDGPKSPSPTLVNNTQRSFTDTNTTQHSSSPTQSKYETTPEKLIKRKQSIVPSIIDESQPILQKRNSIKDQLNQDDVAYKSELEKLSLKGSKDHIEVKQKYDTEESEKQYGEQNYPPEQQYTSDQLYSAETYPDEQQYTDQQYVADPQYSSDQQQYSSDQQQYSSDQQQYSSDQQQYSNDQQQYSSDQMYSTDPQYTMDQQYDQSQYPVDQQYEQQYTTDPKYATDQQYAGQQDYPMDQDYPTEEQQYSTEQQYKEDSYTTSQKEEENVKDKKQTTTKQQSPKQTSKK